MNRCLLLLAVLLLPLPAHSEVVESTAGSFQVRQVREISAPAAKVYDTFVRVASWWNPDHTFSGDASNLSLDARAGGCFCEKVPPEGSVLHLTVVNVAPGKSMTLSGALGPLQRGGIAAAMTLSFEPSSNGTKLTMVYNAGGYLPGGLAAIAPAVDSVLGGQFDRLKRKVETGEAAEMKK